MESISKEEAMETIYNYGIEAHCEDLNNYWRYSEFLDSNIKFLWYYRLNGCIITKGDWDEREYIHFLIHPVSKDADIYEAYKYIVEHERTDDKDHMIAFCAYAPLSEKVSILSYLNCKFTRKGEWYEDSNIRKMTAEDNGIIKELCGDSRNNDNDFGKEEADIFYSWFDDEDLSELIGIFYENKLVGLVSVKIFEKAGIAQVSDLFVHKDYRRLGFGKRLVRAALAVYPDTEYIYNAFKTNNASVELAKSLGFEFAGADAGMWYKRGSRANTSW